MRLRGLAYLSGVILLAASVHLGARQLQLTVLDSEGHSPDIESLVAKLVDKRVVFVGETHDRYDQHLSQLEIIRQLHAQAPERWVIGVEYFQRPFQQYLDAYISGAISEREFLSKTEYFDRWSFDYRLYRPIFTYAREQRIPVIALNAERELTDRVGKVGLAGLSPAERARLPQEIDKSDAAYRERLHAVFEEHQSSSPDAFERFEEVQLTWDETMAEQVSNYLTDHPEKSMIVLAGAGHMMFGAGIPNRVKRRMPGVSTAILLPPDDENAGSGAGRNERRGADYLLVSPMKDLPPAGKLGISMNTSNGVRAREVTPGGAAAQAGIRPKDRIVSIDGEPVRALTDVRLALLDKQPGDRISVGVERDEAVGAEQLSFQLTLQN
jgi:uncharacterized iron-regulated protein